MTFAEQRGRTASFLPQAIDAGLIDGTATPMAQSERELLAHA